MSYGSQEYCNKKGFIDKKSGTHAFNHSANENIRKYLISKILKKEEEIKRGSLFLKPVIISSLKDELLILKKKLSQMNPEINLSEIGIESDPDSVSQNLEETEVKDSISSNEDLIPGNEEELNDILFQSIVDSFTTIVDENNQPVFNVGRIDEDTISISYDEERGGKEEDPFRLQNLDQFFKPIMDIIDKIGFGEENPEEKKQLIIDQIKEALELYRSSFDVRTDKDEEEGKKVLIYKRTNESFKIVSSIYDILKKHGLAGPIAKRHYKKILDTKQESSMGEQPMEANRKSFNLRKRADKVFDSIREKEIQRTNTQYRTMHPKALPWYEDAYIEDAIFRNKIMDKYYPEELNKDGEYRGGYINDRFTVHHNTEGNSMHIRPGKRGNPDRPESYSTERRLEEMRRNNLREYSPSEGSKTEQQTKKVDACVVRKEHGLFKVITGSKVTYLDTEEQVKAFLEMTKLLKKQSDSKKKVAQKRNIDVEIPVFTSTQTNRTDRRADDSPDVNPLFIIVQKYINPPYSWTVREALRHATIELSGSGIPTSEILKYRRDTLKALGLPPEKEVNYDAVPFDNHEEKIEDLKNSME